MIITGPQCRAARALVEWSMEQVARRAGLDVKVIADFEARILSVAGGLAAHGVGQGDCVAILMRNDFAYLEASLAASRLGAYAVPIDAKP